MTRASKAHCGKSLRPHRSSSTAMSRPLQNPLLQPIPRHLHDRLALVRDMTTLHLEHPAALNSLRPRCSPRISPCPTRRHRKAPREDDADPSAGSPLTRLCCQKTPMPTLHPMVTLRQIASCQNRRSCQARTNIGARSSRRMRKWPRLGRTMIRQSRRSWDQPKPRRC